ncbi:PREDICTED: LOW QUALITY PROTEIN probable LRR receptor serine/threonine-, partial [Prunus dulcis]
SSLQREHQKEVHTLDYSFVNIEIVNELDINESNLKINGDSQSHELVDMNDLDLSDGNLDISDDLHSQENEDE